MASMQAITFSLGGVEQLKVSQLDKPEPGPIDVLVRVTAAGVNPVDWKTRQGSGVFGFFAGDGPKVLGWDVAGVVEAIGAGVTRFAVGDRVFGMPHFPQPANAYAQYITSPARQLAKTPDAISDNEAAALPLAGLTAWQAVVDTVNLQAGQRVLIHAAAGGVGHLAVQIAKARGAEVWGTASAAKHELLRELGVDHPIDYRNQPFEEHATNMDAVIDLVGTADYVERSIKSLAPGGKLVVIPSPATLPSAETLKAAGVSATWMLVEPDYHSLEQLAELMVNGRLKVLIGGTAKFPDAASLHTLGEKSSTTGKLVLELA